MRAGLEALRLMVLADTSVWVRHFRRGAGSGRTAIRGTRSDAPLVMGELACGNLGDRTEVLANLQALPTAVPASDAEVLQLIEGRRLWGRGLGWIDVQLLASALLSDRGLWTLDKRLSEAARELGLDSGL